MPNVQLPHSGPLLTEGSQDAKVIDMGEGLFI